MINIGNKIDCIILDRLERIESENGIDFFNKPMFPGRNKIFIITELQWNDQLFLPIRSNLINEIQTDDYGES